MSGPIMLTESKDRPNLLDPSRRKPIAAAPPPNHPRLRSSDDEFALQSRRLRIVCPTGGICNHGYQPRSASTTASDPRTQDPGAGLHAERDAVPEGVAVGPPRQARHFGVLSRGFEPGVCRSDGVV